MLKYVYSFEEGNKSMKNLLGGKGANLAEMTHIGLSIPRGFVVTTEACNEYYKNNQILSNFIIEEIYSKVSELEIKSGKRMGDATNPLLVSIRSGARVSMPGMMDTILNLGMNDDVVLGLIKITNNPRFVYDSYRRFIQMFSDVVKGYSTSEFEKIIDNIKQKRGVSLDTQLTSEDMMQIVSEFKKIYRNYSQEDFPMEPKVQLIEAVKAVFRSWNTERAITYRKLNDIDGAWGTAVNVQEMVYGNKGETSGTGVAFTRNPSTGENKIYGEYLMNAQGEDIVAGIRTPQSIETLKEILPDCYNELIKVANILEKHYKDMQDIEFTIEDKKLYILQTRSGKRTAVASLEIAIDLVNDGLITIEEALLRVNPKQLDQLLHPTFNPALLPNLKPITIGLPASPGSVSGKIFFTADSIFKAKENGEKDLILVRLETSPEDIEGMYIARGILTIRGGMTSHAAVVARGMGRCCISGCSDLIIDEDAQELITKDGKRFKEGDYLSLDGTTGYVYGEKIEMIEPQISGNFEKFMKWTNIRTLKVRANADTKQDAILAMKFGAEGIGLCRTEHMFFQEDRIGIVREMIIAKTNEQRERALEKLLPIQRNDFIEIYREMRGHPVTIRYLDPPLHEFLPHDNEDISFLANELNTDFNTLKQHIVSLKEANPMMGHRGCRITITYPEILVMQTRAIIEAAILVNKEGIRVEPEIMIPLISDINELKYIKKIIIKTINNIFDKHNISLKYTIGTMIEVPRAVLIADEIAKEVDFFSYGTNDLTQMTYGISRDDGSKFLNDYYSKNIFRYDPFVRLDQRGVGELMKISNQKGIASNPIIKLGICGEHGGDPVSVEFFHEIGLHYVSCSPYRIPIAKLALAQAKIKENQKNGY